MQKPHAGDGSKDSDYRPVFEWGNLRPSGHKLDLACRLWGLFIHRQHQRFFTELFPHCLEKAVKAGCSSISEIVEDADGWCEQAGSFQS